jgi:hypothetical protein
MSRRGDRPRYGKTSGIESYQDLAMEFASKVLGLDYNAVFISDRSLLEDFDLDSRTIVDRVKDFYGADISRYLDRPILEILEFLSAQEPNKKRKRPK